MSQKKPKPCTIIIFGATGNLSTQKLLPALYRLQLLDMLPTPFNIVGFATSNLSDEDFKEYATNSVANASESGAIVQSELVELADRIRFISANFNDDAGYVRLNEVLEQIDNENGIPSDNIFYLASSPSFFPIIINLLKKHNLSISKFGSLGSPKIIIEKPFGRDLDSAKDLNNILTSSFNENQIYRIDHYLGKETVQNILFFRFANGIYEPIWNRRYIDHVQITVSESIGVEDRGRYIEEAGILRDMVQNHILQLLALFAMEPPINMNPDIIRGKKLELLDSLRPMTPDDVINFTVRGQYGPGQINGVDIRGYRNEKNVSQKSNTETFVALKLFIDNWRWSEVPFYIRTGKRLKQRISEVAIYFKKVPHCLFDKIMTGCPDTNVLVLRIQPDEGITFQFNVKRPGSSDFIETVNMDFTYNESFDTELPTAYERLLFDCMMGDATLFPDNRAIEESWSFVTDILKVWGELPPNRFPNYQPGSWGPKESDELMAKDGRLWRNP